MPSTSSMLANRCQVLNSERSESNAENKWPWTFAFESVDPKHVLTNKQDKTCEGRLVFEALACEGIEFNKAIERQSLRFSPTAPNPQSPTNSTCHSPHAQPSNTHGLQCPERMQSIQLALSDPCSRSLTALAKDLLHQAFTGCVS